MSNRIDIYINSELFSSYPYDGKIPSLQHANNIAYNFMAKRFSHYLSERKRDGIRRALERDAKISFFEGDSGDRIVKIKIISKELTREVILNGLLKDDGSI